MLFVVFSTTILTSLLPSSTAAHSEAIFLLPLADLLLQLLRPARPHQLHLSRRRQWSSLAPLLALAWASLLPLLRGELVRREKNVEMPFRMKCTYGSAPYSCTLRGGGSVNVGGGGGVHHGSLAAAATSI